MSTSRACICSVLDHKNDLAPWVPLVNTKAKFYRRCRWYRRISAVAHVVTRSRIHVITWASSPTLHRPSTNSTAAQASTPRNAHRLVVQPAANAHEPLDIAWARVDPAASSRGPRVDPMSIDHGREIFRGRGHQYQVPGI